MATKKQAYAKGLEDVIAGESAICTVDGRAGRLIYRGLEIRDLAKNSTFEETTYLLWFGSLPTASQLRDFSGQLAASRQLPDGLMPLLRGLPKHIGPMDALRTGVSALGHFDPDAEDDSAGANGRKAIRIMARIPTLVAAQYRLRAGREPVAPRSDLGHAANFLYMINDKLSQDDEARALDIALILHADHELNASTFSARVTAATLSDLYSAITSAVGTLKGPLHGGANEAVMRMLRRVGADGDGKRFAEEEFAQGRKLSGFGHRVYRTWDPRAIVLHSMACPVTTEAFGSIYCRVAEQISDTVIAQRKIYPNVDYYSGQLYDNLGIPMELFTPLFAISRTAGWIAHVLEQYADNRLIRPRAIYTGPDHLPYVPVEERKPKPSPAVEAVA